jgi:hypothetical protein
MFLKTLKSRFDSHSNLAIEPESTALAKFTLLFLLCFFSNHCNKNDTHITYLFFIMILYFAFSTFDQNHNSEVIYIQL